MELVQRRGQVSRGAARAVRADGTDTNRVENHGWLAGDRWRCVACVREFCVVRMEQVLWRCVDGSLVLWEEEGRYGVCGYCCCSCVDVVFAGVGRRGFVLADGSCVAQKIRIHSSLQHDGEIVLCNGSQGRFTCCFPRGWYSKHNSIVTAGDQ